MRGGPAARNGDAAALARRRRAGARAVARRDRLRLRRGAARAPGGGASRGCCRWSATSAASAPRRSISATPRSGRYDAYYEHGVSAWDMTAGALVCRCAGLEVRELAGGILAAPPALAGELAAIVDARRAVAAPRRGARLRVLSPRRWPPRAASRSPRKQRSSRSRRSRSAPACVPDEVELYGRYKAKVNLERRSIASRARPTGS